MHVGELVAKPVVDGQPKFRVDLASRAFSDGSGGTRPRRWRAGRDAGRYQRSWCAPRGGSSSCARACGGACRSRSSRSGSRSRRCSRESSGWGRRLRSYQPCLDGSTVDRIDRIFCIQPILRRGTRALLRSRPCRRSAITPSASSRSTPTSRGRTAARASRTSSRSATSTATATAAVAGRSSSRSRSGVG